jgi:cardiolipin synthase
MRKRSALLQRYAVALRICSTILLIFAISIISAQGTHIYSSSASMVQITEFYPNAATKFELDEYIVITNSGFRSVDIEGWKLTDNEGTLIFPHVTIAPDQALYVTKNASAFVEQRSTATDTAIIPDFEFEVDSDPDVRQMQTKGRFALRNAGDEVILYDESGRLVDAVIYGDSVYNENAWSSAALEKPKEGLVFKRRGNYDTDKSEDWILLSYGASYFPTKKIIASGEVTAFVSPDCSFQIVQREIEHASSALFINLYQFENPYLMDAVLKALHRGVNVFLLLEGHPVGGITDEELYIVDKIKEGGGNVRFSCDPFINHAKYIVIDNKTLVLMTENWGCTGIPYNNTFGNRGWGIVIRNKDVAQYFGTVLLDDFHRGKESFTGLWKVEPCFAMSRAIPKSSYRPIFEPLTVYSNFTVVPFLAPDTAMDEETIVGAINSAQEQVLVQQFSTGRFWDDNDNPFILSLINAARSGCDVKVLLDSKYLEGGNNNDEVVSWLNDVASEEKLSLEAKLADLDSLGLTKIHTKGLIVDGEKVIIASLNWNANSIHNREAGVIVEDKLIASFYEDVFFHDWNVSERVGEEERKGVTPVSIRILWVVVTLLVSFAIFRVVKWYKRL